MKIRALLVILLTLACAGAYAQDGGVKGKVVSRDGRVALSNVKVVVEPLGVTVMTDNHGNFNIDQLPKGEYQLKFEAPEFENLDLAIRVDKMVKNLNSVVMAPMCSMSSTTPCSRSSTPIRRRRAVAAFVAFVVEGCLQQHRLV